MSVPCRALISSPERTIKQPKWNFGLTIYQNGCCRVQAAHRKQDTHERAGNATTGDSFDSDSQKKLLPAAKKGKNYQTGVFVFQFCNFITNQFGSLALLWSQLEGGEFPPLEIRELFSRLVRPLHESFGGERV